MTNITPYKAPEFEALKNFQDILNRAPGKRHIKISPSSDKAKYLPIGVIETILDETYGGMWQTTGKVELIGNSIVATVTLEVLHPVARVWIKRTGVGAKKVQLNKGAQAMDTAQMKADAFEKGVPAAKSMALRNAAASLGQTFGRNLNRELDDYAYEYLDDQVGALTERSLEATALVDTAKLPEDTKKAIRSKIDRAGAKELTEIINYLTSKQ